jgi:hypothetical protein
MGRLSNAMIEASARHGLDLQSLFTTDEIFRAQISVMYAGRPTIVHADARVSLFGMSSFDTRAQSFVLALARASDESNLQDYYRDCVKPLFNMPMSQWPMCCGGGCEPCAQTLVAVALRTCELLEVDPHTLS